MSIAEPEPRPEDEYKPRRAFIEPVPDPEPTPPVEATAPNPFAEGNDLAPAPSPQADVPAAVTSFMEQLQKLVSPDGLGRPTTRSTTNEPVVEDLDAPYQEALQEALADTSSDDKDELIRIYREAAALHFEVERRKVEEDFKHLSYHLKEIPEMTEQTHDILLGLAASIADAVAARRAYPIWLGFELMRKTGISVEDLVNHVYGAARTDNTSIAPDSAEEEVIDTIATSHWSTSLPDRDYRAVIMPLWDHNDFEHKDGH